MSVTQLAAVAGVSESTARTWLAGTAAPRSATLARIATHFNVSMREFFDEGGQK